MRVISWNVNHWQRNEHDRWDLLMSALQEMHADVALLQEVLPPAAEPGRIAFRPISETDARLRWGTAVVATSDSLTLDEWELVPLGKATQARQIELSHPGTMVVVDAVSEAGSICTLVSLYGQMIWTANGTKYASTTVHRQISDLAPVLDRGRQGVLVAGDLNVTTQWDTRPRDREMDRTVFDRMQAHGFRELVREGVDPGAQTDCFCPEAGTCRHVRTLRFRNASDSRPWHIDYAFANPTLRATASVLDDESWWALSDHAPLCIDIDEQVSAP